MRRRRRWRPRSSAEIRGGFPCWPPYGLFHRLLKPARLAHGLNSPSHSRDVRVRAPPCRAVTCCLVSPSKEGHSMRFEGTSGYVATDDLKVAVNAAITLERPLLV